MRVKAENLFSWIVNGSDEPIPQTGYKLPLATKYEPISIAIVGIRPEVTNTFFVKRKKIAVLRYTVNRKDCMVKIPEKIASKLEQVCDEESDTEEEPAAEEPPAEEPAVEEPTVEEQPAEEPPAEEPPAEEELSSDDSSSDEDEEPPAEELTKGQWNSLVQEFRLDGGLCKVISIEDDVITYSYEVGADPDIKYMKRTTKSKTERERVFKKIYPKKRGREKGLSIKPVSATQEDNPFSEKSEDEEDNDDCKACNMKGPGRRPSHTCGLIENPKKKIKEKNSPKSKMKTPKKEKNDSNELSAIIEAFTTSVKEGVQEGVKQGISKGIIEAMKLKKD